MRVLKKWIFGPQPIDKSQCIFCNNTFTINEEGKHYEDDKYFVITDINQASSIKHLLVITKEHIGNALQVKDQNILLQMKKIGQKVLVDISTKLFGFHLPPFNSIDHLHLHCFIEPITSIMMNKFHYGWVLNSVEDVIIKIRQKK